MSKTLYFSGNIELKDMPIPLSNERFAALFPGVIGLRYDSFRKLAGRHEGKLMPITRIIYRKANPSNHKCGARCRSATGPNCECACGGRDHGTTA